MPNPIPLAEILLGWGGVFGRLQMSPSESWLQRREEERKGETDGRRRRAGVRQSGLGQWEGILWNISLKNSSLGKGDSVLGKEKQ